MEPKWISLDEIAEHVMVKVGTHGSVDADGTIHREDIMRDRPITEKEMREMFAYFCGAPIGLES